MAPSAQSTNVSGSSTTVYVDDATDYITVNLYQNSGASLNAIGNNDDATHIVVSRIDTATGISNSSGASGRVQLADGSGGFTSDSDLTFSGSTLTATNIAGTLTTAAQTAITSVGILTALQVDNININGNTISSTAGTDLLITPLTGQQIVLDGTIIVDAGVVTGATSITSTAFVGALTGNASGTAATVTGGTQASITAAANLVTVGIIGTGVWQGTAITSSYIADDAIDSEHYANRSIDTIHIGLKQVTLAEMAGGTDGNLITYDASGDPVAVATGDLGQVLTSAGAGAPPTFTEAGGTKAFAFFIS